jgi:hypothetical protein
VRIAKLCEVRVTGHDARGVGSPVLPPQARSAPVFPSSASDDDSKFASRKTFFVRGRDEHFFARFSKRNCKAPAFTVATAPQFVVSRLKWTLMGDTGLETGPGGQLRRPTCSYAL